MLALVASPRRAILGDSPPFSRFRQFSRWVSRRALYVSACALNGIGTGSIIGWGAGARKYQFLYLCHKLPGTTILLPLDRRRNDYIILFGS